jgi:hypothetical protein
MNSVVDIPNESHFEPKKSFLPKASFVALLPIFVSPDHKDAEIDIRFSLLKFA